MRRRALFSVVLSILFGSVSGHAAQTHPDFSGKWELVPATGRADAPVRPPFGTTFTIAQTDAKLTLTHTMQGRGNTTTAVTTYSLDGVMSNVTMIATAGGGNNHVTYTTSAWEGDRLVNSGFWTPAPEPIKPSSTMVFSLNKAGELVIEHEQNNEKTVTRYRKIG
jgi:hypothetical protein